jgi:hypothetical protein
MIIFLERKAFGAKILAVKDKIYEENKKRLRKTFITYDTLEKVWWVRIEVKEKSEYIGDYDQTYILAFDRTENRKTSANIEGFVKFLRECGVKKMLIDIPSE